MSESRAYRDSIVRVVTIRDQVVNAIRKAILDFDFAPGQRLVEGRLAAMFGVSRPTIREALGALRSEGLVTMVPQQGAVVAVPDPADAADLYEIRIRLEGLVVERFVEKATPEQIAAFSDAVERVAALERDNAPINDVLAGKDLLFDVLVQGAASPALRQVVGSIQARVRLLRARSMSCPGRLAKSVAELREVAQAAADRDVERAVALYAEHLRAAAAVGIAALQDVAADPARSAVPAAPAVASGPPTRRKMR